MRPFTYAYNDIPYYNIALVIQTSDGLLSISLGVRLNDEWIFFSVGALRQPETNHNFLNKTYIITSYQNLIRIRNTMVL